MTISRQANTDVRGVLDAHVCQGTQESRPVRR